MLTETAVYIVDDDKSILDSVRILLNMENIATITFDSGKAFLDSYQSDMKGCLLLDVRMPEMSGLELQEKLIERGINIPVIIMTGHGDIKIAVRAMKLGAFDFIEKPFKEGEIISAVQNALKSLQLSENGMEDIRKFRLRVEQLTDREREVLMLLVEGYSNKAIAAELEISPRTVELHRAHIKEKLQVRNLSQLIKMFLKSAA